MSDRDTDVAAGTTRQIALRLIREQWPKRHTWPHIRQALRWNIKVARDDK